MKCLIDTCIVSELVKPRPNEKVVAFLAAQASVDLYLPVLVLGKIRTGIERARPTKPDGAARYEAWLARLTSDYGERLLPSDAAAADNWGRLMAAKRQAGVEDAQIAAIALARGLVVVTRNIADFEPFGMPVYNPF